jgi:hypothetical protein
MRALVPLIPLHRAEFLGIRERRRKRLFHQHMFAGDGGDRHVGQPAVFGRREPCKRTVADEAHTQCAVAGVLGSPRRRSGTG